jgi:ferric-dicitrate binding protein FerR (iron transport regulator)
MFLSKTSNADYFLWKDGIYTFDNEKLIDIIKKLELYYDVTIKIEDPEIFDVRYTGKFRQRDGIEEILRIIQKIQKFNIHKDRENNIITLTKYNTNSF